MPTVLITGANRGLGLEFVKQYANDKWTIIAACRTPEKASDLQTLAKNFSSIQLEALDIANDQSIGSLAEKLKNTPIDLLINNAGIYSGASSKASAETGDQAQTFGAIDSAAWEKVLRINTIAPIMMAEAFVPHLKKGGGKKIVNITSRMGSLSIMGAGSLAYRSSKTALNAAMRAITDDLQNLGIAIFNFHPGWVKTDMGGKGAALTPEESISSMRKAIANLQPANSGQFLNYDGQTLPW